MPIALRLISLDAFFDGFDRGAAGVAIRIDRLPAFAAEQLIHRQAGPLTQDVPQRHIDAAQRVVQHRPVPPIAAEPRRLRNVLDLRGVFADQKRPQIFIDGSGHDAGPLRERGAAQAIQARLAGRHFHDNQPSASGAVRIALTSVILSGPFWVARASGPCWPSQQRVAGHARAGRRPAAATRAAGQGYLRQPFATVHNRAFRNQDSSHGSTRMDNDHRISVFDPCFIRG